MKNIGAYSCSAYSRMFCKVREVRRRSSPRENIHVCTIEFHARRTAIIYVAAHTDCAQIL